MPRSNITECHSPHYFGGSRGYHKLNQKIHNMLSVSLSKWQQWYGGAKVLIHQLPRPFLLLGDFNAKHPAWDFENSADPRGRAVQSLLVEVCGMFNQGRPTHYHIQTNILSATDLCLCSVGELWDFQLEVDEDLHGSGHFPIYLTGAEYIPQHQVPRWIIDKANWDQFTEITKQIAGIRDSEPLEFYGQIMGKITEGATKSIPKSDGYYKVTPVPWWNANCTNLEKEHLKAQKQSNSRPTVRNKIKHKRLRAMFQRMQKDSQNSSWKKYVSTLNSNTEDANVGKKVDKIKGKYQPKPPPTLTVNGTTLIKPKEVATALAEHYASASVKTTNLHRTAHNRAQVKRRRAPFSIRGGHPDNVLLNAPLSQKRKWRPSWTSAKTLHLVRMIWYHYLHDKAPDN